MSTSDSKSVRFSRDTLILVINGVVERRGYILKEIQDKWSIPRDHIHLIEPLDDTQIETSEFRPCPSWIDPHERRFLTQGELKCSLGHYAAWKAIAEGTASWGVVLEDDAELTILEDDFLPLDPSKQDLIYLGHKALESVEPPASGNLSLAPYTYWTIGYIIHREAAQRLVRAFVKDQIIPSDEFLPYHFGRNPQVKQKIHRQADCENLQAFLHFPEIVKPSGKWRSETENAPSAFDFAVLLFATDPSKVAHIQAYRDLGYQVHVIGDGLESWDTSGQGGYPKIPATLKYIKQNFPPDQLHKTVLLFADGYDTLPIVSPKILLKRFAEMGASIMVSGEVTCWPDKGMKDGFKDPTLRTTHDSWLYPYPCSGLYMGHGPAVLDFLQRMIDTGERTDDQLAMHKAIEVGVPNLKIDGEAYLFQSLSGAMDHVCRRKGDPYNWKTRCYPAVIHGNNHSSMDSIYPMPWKAPKLHPSAFEFIEVAPGILKMPFLSEGTTEHLLHMGHACDHLWKPLPGDKVPGDEIRLKAMDVMWWGWFESALKEHLKPILDQRWFPASWGSLKDLFLIRYSAEKQPYLQLHNDHSYFSCSVKLLTAGYGGQLHFPRQNYNDALVKDGELLVWPAKITHPHQVTPVLKGQRVSLIVWTNE